MTRNEHKPLRVVMALKNNRLIRAREERGFASCPAAAAALGVRYETLVGFESCKRGPWDTRTEDWTKNARQVAAAYGLDPEYFWPDVVRAVRQTRITMELDAADALALCAGRSAKTPEDRLLEDERASDLGEAMGYLSPFERGVLEERFGLTDDREKTRREIGERFEVHGTRIAQIEARALQKVRRRMEQMETNRYFTNMSTLPRGTEVVVRLDNGTKWRTRTRSEPWQLPSGHWVVLLGGRTGGYDLDRVTVAT